MKMKIRYFIPILLGVLGLFSSCSQDNSITLLDGLQVSSSYVSIPMDGGSNSITINSKSDWTIEKVVSKKDSLKWLTVSTATGSAGETEVTFQAPKTLDGRNAELLIHSGDKVQHVNIIQGLATVSPATCAEVIAGPDSKTYSVTGVCTSISSDVYGNWYLADKTGSIYIYGTLDAKGDKQNFKSLGIEVGDEVTVQGPKKTYGTTVELVDVTVININKSLIKVDSVKNATLPVEGGNFTTYVTCKGQGVSVNIPDDAKSWLSISSIQTVGTQSVVIFKALNNNGGDRNTTLTFTTTDGKKQYTSQTAVKQLGAIVTSTVANFNAAPISTTQYRLTGVISSVASDVSGNFNLKDFSGETYIYKLPDFKTKGLKVGDIVTVVGTRGAYKTTIEMLTPTLEKFTSVIPTTIADVLTRPDDNNVYYMLTGTISQITNATYGNLYLQSGDQSILVYGLYGYGATGADQKNFVTNTGLKVGDTLTLLGTKTTYNGTIELKNGTYFSHVSAQ